MKCLKNTIFPIKIIFKKPNLKFQADRFLTLGLDAGPSGRLRFISQLLSGGVMLCKLKMKSVLFPSLINGLQIQGSKTLISQLKLILLSYNCLIKLISGCRVLIRIRSLILERMFALFY